MPSKDCAISDDGGKSLRELACTAVLGLVATMVNLMDSLGRAVRKF